MALACYVKQIIQFSNLSSSLISTVVTVVGSVVVIFVIYQQVFYFVQIIPLKRSTDASGTWRKESDDFLNRQYFSLIKNFACYYISSAMVSGECSKPMRMCNRSFRLIPEYKKKDVIHCFDSLSAKKKRQPIHIAFIGDSTVRQHFTSFIQWIPDYDRKTESISTAFAELAFHEDMNVTSKILDNLRVSFYWRNLIRNDLKTDFERWNFDDNHQAPDFILLGITVHHLIKNNNVTSNLQMYQTLLENEIVPLINRSLNVNQNQEIVWLHQSAVIESLAPNEHQVGHGIYTEKINKYNLKIRQIFKDTRVVMWDAINSVVEEYIRACALTQFNRFDMLWYQNCKDSIHPGTGALSLGTQLIINHICAEAV